MIDHKMSIVLFHGRSDIKKKNEITREENPLMQDWQINGEFLLESVNEKAIEISRAWNKK